MTSDGMKLEIRINAEDLERLERALDVDGRQKTLHEQQQTILDQQNIIASQERELREARNKMREMYGELDVLRQKSNRDGSSPLDTLEKFPTNTLVKIWRVLPGMYKVGYQDNLYTYVPAISSYYPLAEAIERCYSAYIENRTRKDGKK